MLFPRCYITALKTNQGNLFRVFISLTSRHWTMNPKDVLRYQNYAALIKLIKQDANMRFKLSYLLIFVLQI